VFLFEPSGDVARLILSCCTGISLFHFLASMFVGLIEMATPIPVAMIKALGRQGKGERQIARELEMSRWVVRRVMQSA